jgi:tripartite-type tricarboxylate transporter receptor subunit TctC
MIPISTAVLSAIRKDLPYDLQRDLAPVSLVSTGPFLLLVHPSLPARTVKDFITLARSQPGKLNYGSPGVGTANHLAGELFAMMAKVQMVHVPYKGAADAVVATASGHIAASFPSVAGTLPLLDSGKLRALAVTSAKRVPSLPTVPTLDESGVTGYDYFAWYGVGAPAQVPKDVIARLNGAIVKAVQTPDMKDALAKQGFEAQGETPERFGALIRREIERTAKLIAATGLKLD